MADDMRCWDGGGHEPVASEYNEQEAMYVLAALDRPIGGVDHQACICRHCKALVWIPRIDVNAYFRRAR
jgi:hypothetical protein